VAETPDPQVRKGERLGTVLEAARRLNVSALTVWDEVRAGNLTAERSAEGEQFIIYRAVRSYRPS
jgi:excisionase family DNA binding protein